MQRFHVRCGATAPISEAGVRACVRAGGRAGGERGGAGWRGGGGGEGVTHPSLSCLGKDGFTREAPLYEPLSDRPPVEPVPAGAHGSACFPFLRMPRRRLRARRRDALALGELGACGAEQRRVTRHGLCEVLKHGDEERLGGERC